LINWRLTPTLAVFQLQVYHGVANFFDILIFMTTRPLDINQICA